MGVNNKLCGAFVVTITTCNRNDREFGWNEFFQ